MDDRQRRAEAARRYKPEKVKLLLVAEAPPADPERYFYFPEVKERDSLFRYVVREVLGEEPIRENKPELLQRLSDEGVFLIDLRLDPVDGSPLAEGVPDLITRCSELAPDRIVLIKATVYDTRYKSLLAAGLPVVNVRIPFPDQGWQARFQIAFRQALSTTPPRGHGGRSRSR
jgi:hypothetical protein